MVSPPSWKNTRERKSVQLRAPSEEFVRLPSPSALIGLRLLEPTIHRDLLFPTFPVRDGEHLSIDGVELVVDDFGPTESSDNTAIELPQIDSVIISDLVYNRVHPWLAEGRSDLWLRALDEAKRRYHAARALYPGHGSAGPISIIDEQTAYIIAVRDMVASSLKQDPELSDTTKAAIQQKVRATYKDYPTGDNRRYERGQPRWRGQVATKKP